WLAASMSAAWLLAARIVVIGGILQNDLDVAPPFGDGEAWAAAAITFAALVAVGLLIARRDFAFGAVIAWALLAIGQEQTNEVVDTAVVAAVVVIGLVALGSIPRTSVPLPWRKRHEERARAN